MNKLNRRLPQVDPSHFAMVPRNDVPRSTFDTQHTIKHTMDCDYLYPLYVDEVLPGDVHDGKLTVFARLNNLIFPLMDNLTVETFFFFVPCRLVWNNWQKFMGEQANPGDSISYTIPQLASPAGGFIANGLADAMGLPTVGQVGAGNTINVNALPFRCVNLIYNEWFRDENLQQSTLVPKDDGPDNIGAYNLEKRGKKHDYFTSSLPWPVKGGQGVSFPLAGQATVKTQLTPLYTGVQQPILFNTASSGGFPIPNTVGFGTGVGSGQIGPTTTATGMSAGAAIYPSNLYADLASATGTTINAMRLAVATQQFLEKDARGGTRYTELLKNHFGVSPEDARLQRPEYIGGGRSPIVTQAMPQTSVGTATDPLGRLAGQGVLADQHRFKYHATEHGYIIGLVNITGDVTYQQGLNKMWSRQTRYDFYWPTFANLGEQAVLNKEIYCRGDANDNLVFGYQERWAEYRYRPSSIRGLFKSTTSGNIDDWHVAEQFSALPVLNAQFIRQNTPAARVLAAGLQANTQQILWDSVFDIRCTRPIPTYSVPGLLRF
ncbi:MAG: major capsid protein [Microvirus sp.]|nr:MAG: major capsid protein [Microvirus sp.]